MELSEERSSQQFAGGVVVAFLKRAAELERGLALSGSGGACHGEQCVGHLGHGADHDHGSLRQSPLHDGSNAVDGPRVSDRSAAELHHDHRRDFLMPCGSASGCGFIPDIP